MPYLFASDLRTSIDKSSFLFFLPIKYSVSLLIPSKLAANSFWLLALPNLILTPSNEIAPSFCLYNDADNCFPSTVSHPPTTLASMSMPKFSIIDFSATLLVFSFTSFGKSKISDTIFLELRSGCSTSLVSWNLLALISGPVDVSASCLKFSASRLVLEIK